MILARVALACSYLSGVADRFGLWPARYEGYKDFDGFIGYTAKVNAFMPAWTIVYLAWAATAAELALGIAFLVGYKQRWVASASAALLLMFGTAMALSFGLKSPLDYSVFSAMGASLLLAAFAPPSTR
jgi:uncharacterized membrane protein YphA (DoxX/SURF4 family)